MKNQFILGGDIFAVLYGKARGKTNSSYISSFRKWKNGEKNISYQNLTDNIKISVELEQLD